MPAAFRHLVSAKDLTRDDAEAVLAVAAEMEKVREKGGDDRLKGKILASLFYEPSTRTRLSFESAMHRLGGSVITADGLDRSSMKKGETIEDTMRMIEQYADIIAMRHPEEGSAKRAAAVLRIPFLNAGDGPGEHPTQALTDLFTMRKEKGSIDGLHVAMVGDLLYGRTVHSLASVLSLFPGVRFTFVSPPKLQMPSSITALLSERGANVTVSEDLTDGLDADILYMTRVQEERFDTKAEYEGYRDAYILTVDHLQGKSATVMHPLPRVTEISTDVDALPNAAYFRQAGNGVAVRMALLAMMLGVA